MSETFSRDKRIKLSALLDKPEYISKIEVTAGEMHPHHSTSLMCSFEYKPNKVMATVKLETTGGELLRIPLSKVSKVVMESNKVTIKGSSYDIFS
ncbi:hypothetical protein [Shimazuella kribbensis]|uniref:hypothetical protein n=1 Tax=Shimazuella kribbensis TaxID=139808 RepID=UPI0004217527|nr:hypothetical protein [Shimazuella kribbensis]